MAYPVAIPDHVARALARLPARHQGQANTEALLTVVLDEVQAVEDMLIALMTGRTLRLAEGTQLDRLAAQLGQQRLGRTDSALRARLYLAVAQHMSQGTLPEVLNITDLIGFDSTQWTNLGDAAAIVNFIGASTVVSQDEVRGILEGATAPITLDLVVTPDPDLAFAFFEDATGLGFDDGTNLPTAGVFSEAL